ncbi:MAG: hypothetical protein V4568_15710 [Pseudomonadota bacterium]
MKSVKRSTVSFWRTVHRNTILALFSSLIAACGGGGGGSSDSGNNGSSGSDNNLSNTASGPISGVVAVGAPVAGATVTIKGASESRITTTDKDGHYKVDIRGMTGPFVIEAKKIDTINQQHQEMIVLHSVSAIGETANVNPVTEQATTAAAIKAGFTNAADAFNQNAAIAPGNVRAYVGNLTVAIHDTLLAGCDNQDFLSGAYVADGKCHDKVIDTLNVSINPGTGEAKLTSKADDSISKTVSANRRLSTDDVTPLKIDQVAEDIQDIAGMLKNFADVINEKGTSVSAADLDIFYDDAYLSSGENKADHIAKVASSSQKAANLNATLQYSGIHILRTIWDADNNRTIYYVANLGQRTDVQGSVVQFSNNDGYVARDADGKMKFLGGHFNFSIENFHFLSVRRVTATEDRVDSGIALNVPNSSTKTISAVNVSGPGLPTAGLNLIQCPSYWCLNDADRNDPTDASFYVSDGIYFFDDATIDSQFSNNGAPFIYTLSVSYSDGSSEVAHIQYYVPPVKASVVNANVLTPTLSGLNGHSLSSIGLTDGTPVPIGFALPNFANAGMAGTTLSSLSVRDFFSNSQTGISRAGPIALNATSYSLALPPQSGGTGEWTSGRFYLYAFDNFGREFSTVWTF